MLEFLNNIEKSQLILILLNLGIVIGFSFFSYGNLSKLKLFNIFSNIILFLITSKIILSNNIAHLTFLILIYFFVVYFIKTNFTNDKTNKKRILFSLIFDYFILLCTIFLFLIDFLRYLLLNNISLEIQEIISYLHEMNEGAIFFAFLGTLLLLFRLFEFFPLNISSNLLSNTTNTIILSQQKLYEALIGTSLILKTYSLFNEQIVQFQKYILIYLIFNAIWFSLTIFKTKNAFKFIATSYSLHASYALICLFSSYENSMPSFIYFMLILIISILAISLLFSILCNKFKTNDLANFKPIGDKTRIVQIYSILILINLAKIFPSGLFVPNMILFINIFNSQLEELGIITPYILVVGLFTYALSSINLITKLISNTQNNKLDIRFTKLEFLIFTLIIFTIIGLCVYPQHFFDEFILSIES